MNSRRFSLIELLVVIAIIAILSSLLLPSLGDARDKAKMSVCKSNMKQIKMAIMMYAEDNDGRYPYSRTANPRHYSWDDLIYGYDGRNGATKSELDYPVLFASAGHSSGSYECPSDDVERTHWTGTDLVKSSYSLTWRVINGAGNLTGWARGISLGGEGNTEKGKKITEVRLP